MPVVRFAPSPNGPLHLGHAYAALRNERVAERLGATVRLRLEDIDTARCTPAHGAAVLDDLAWFGFRWGGAVVWQSARFALYAQALDRLAARDLVYPCFCTRGAIARAIAGRPGWPHDPDGAPLYPGTCRGLGAAEQADRLARHEPFALRLDITRAMAGLRGPLAWREAREGTQLIEVAARPTLWGDAVLRRKDIPASYHLAVTFDDAAQGITDVVRGDDLFAATSLHRLLQHLLDWPAPAYHHHRLVRDAAGEKLSKSRGSAALGDLRAQGLSPAAVRDLLDRLMAA